MGDGSGNEEKWTLEIYLEVEVTGLSDEQNVKDEKLKMILL